jgi:hypothetical protein
MPESDKPAKGYYAGLIAIILSAAAASGTVFFLFDSFLESLVPPYGDSKQTVAFASFGTAIGLLILSLAIQKRLTAASTRMVCIICGVLLLLSIVLFGHFRDMSRTYVYRFPPSSLPLESQKLHIRGDLDEKGRDVVGNKTIAQAVYELGGPDFVNEKGLLWSEESRLARISRIEMEYIALAMLLTTALFTAALAVWRLGNEKK